MTSRCIARPAGKAVDASHGLKVKAFKMFREMLTFAHDLKIKAIEVEHVSYYLALETS